MDYALVIQYRKAPGVCTCNSKLKNKKENFKFSFRFKFLCENFYVKNVLKKRYGFSENKVKN